MSNFSNDEILCGLLLVVVIVILYMSKKNEQKNLTRRRNRYRNRNRESSLNDMVNVPLNTSLDSDVMGSKHFGDPRWNVDALEGLETQPNRGVSLNSLLNIPIPQGMPHDESDPSLTSVQLGGIDVEDDGARLAMYGDNSRNYSLVN